jgi:hypothetical protein
MLIGSTCIAAAAAVAAWYLYYSPHAKRLEAQARQVQAQTQQRDEVREYLNDPDSAVFRRDFAALTGKHVWCGEVNARNRMGGMIGFTRYVIYLRAGEEAGDYPAIFFDGGQNDLVFISKWHIFCE